MATAALLAFSGVGCTAKMKTSYHLHRARHYYDAGQWANAEIEYKNVLRNAPQNAEAWGRLGFIYFDEGRLPEAASLLYKAEQLDGGNLAVRWKLGAVYAAAGNLQAARDEASFVLDRNPADEQAPILLASTAGTTNDIAAIRSRLQMMREKSDSAPVEVACGLLALRERDFKTAETSFSRARMLNPKFSETYTAWGSLYAAQKDWKRADAAFQEAAALAPPSSGNAVRYAQFKILRGEDQAGEQVLREMVKKSPDYLPAWLTLAEIAASRNDYTNSLALLDNVLSRDPQNFDGLALQGHLELLAGRTRQAITGLERMAKMFPQVPSVHYHLAQACLADNATNEANASLTQALKLNPNYTDAIQLLAEIQIRNGNAGLAVISLTRLVKQQPQLVPAWLLLAEAYGAQGALDSALQVYKQLEKAYPHSPQIHLMLGSVYWEQQKAAAARAEFEDALQSAPDYLPALERLVDLDLADKQYSAALQRVQQWAVKNPNQAALQLLLGRTFAAAGETSEAETALSKAIALEPDSQAAYLLLAHLRILSGQNQQALADLQSALARNPNDLAALMVMGSVYDAGKDYEKSRAIYEKLLAIAPDNAMALNNLACVLTGHLDQSGQALALARRAHELVPADPSIADTLGWILYQKGDYIRATELLRESAGKSGRVAEVEFHLGMAEYMTGKESDARTALLRALELNDEFTEKDACRQHLAILNIDPAKAGNDLRAWLEKWVSHNPADPVALGRLAALYQEKGMAGPSVATYEALLKTNPQNVAALVNLARLFAPTDAPKAYTFAKSAIQLTPNDPEVSHLTGRLAFLNGDYSWALSLLQLAAQAQPRNPAVLFDLGEVLYSLGRVPEAKTNMENALQTGASFAHSNDARSFLAMTSLADHPLQAMAAQTQIAGILKATPHCVPALMVNATIAGQKGEMAAAEQIYEVVLTQYPDFAPAEKQLAIFLAKEPVNDSQAFPLAVKAHRALPDDPEVTKTLGLLVYRQGDYVQAVDLLRQCVRPKDQNPELMYYLGMAQYRLKHGAESKFMLQKALELNLSGSQAAEAKLILAELK
jgi:tetratricopeptide (TPR) repeat protein